jgi:cytochrome c oxidase subunit 1
MHYVGLNGMPRRIYTYAEEFGWEGLNLLSTIGYFIIFIGVLVFIVNFLRSVRSGQESGHDPWDAPGVEWSISSPPPVYNFARIPRIVGRDHYWIVKRRAEAEGQPITGPEPHVDPRTIHMPSPSYWPIVVSFGLAWLAAGFLIPFPLDYIKYPISFIGGIITIWGIIGWSNEPPAAESHEPHHGAEAHHHQEA